MSAMTTTAGKLESTIARFLFLLIWTWNKIRSLDMSMVRAKLMSSKHEGMTEEQADVAIEAYRRYLFMTFVTDFPVVPSLAADAAWHHHILHTEQYFLDCAHVFGRYLHHFPSAEDASPEDRARMLQYAHDTNNLYRLLFGEATFYSCAEVADCDGGCRRCQCRIGNCT